MTNAKKIYHVIDSFCASLMISVIILITVAGCLKRAHEFERDLTIPMCPTSVCLSKTARETIQTAEYELKFALQFTLVMAAAFPLTVLSEVYMFTPLKKTNTPMSSSEGEKKEERVPSMGCVELAKRKWNGGAPPTEEGMGYHELGV